jgi:hypothetical protein
VVDHLAAGKLVSSEMDSYYLPDTKGTAYRAQHVKTTIVAQDIDVEARRLGYFHNAGYFELEGEDFAALFRLGLPHDPDHMPFFAELIRVDRVIRRPEGELAAMATALLRKHLGRRPPQNPVERFARRLAEELPALQQRGLPHYHAWAFATVRQLGSAFELAAAFLRWLEARGGVGPLAPAAEAFDLISATAKTLILKGARAVNARKPTDFAPLLAPAVAAWDEGMSHLRPYAA